MLIPMNWDIKLRIMSLSYWAVASQHFSTLSDTHCTLVLQYSILFFFCLLHSALHMQSRLQTLKSRLSFSCSNVLKSSHQRNGPCHVPPEVPKLYWALTITKHWPFFHIKWSAEEEGIPLCVGHPLFLSDSEWESNCFQAKQVWRAKPKLLLLLQ